MSLSVLNYLSEKKSAINLILIFYSILLKVNELWIAVIAVLATLIGCMFGISIGVLLGIACGFKMQQKMTKKRNEINYSIDVPGQTATDESTPVYEDVQCSENKDSIEFSSNLVYEAVTNLNK